MSKLSTDVSRCEGGSCPSKDNCRRYTERKVQGDYVVNAALWLRREAGASACDSYLPVRVISTFASEVANA